MAETASDKYIFNPEWVNTPFPERFHGDVLILNPNSKHNQSKIKSEKSQPHEEYLKEQEKVEKEKSEF